MTLNISIMGFFKVEPNDLAALNFQTSFPSSVKQFTLPPDNYLLNYKSRDDQRWSPYSSQDYKNVGPLCLSLLNCLTYWSTFDWLFNTYIRQIWEVIAWLSLACFPDIRGRRAINWTSFWLDEWWLCKGAADAGVFHRKYTKLSIVQSSLCCSKHYLAIAIALKCLEPSDTAFEMAFLSAHTPRL